MSIVVVSEFRGLTGATTQVPQAVAYPLAVNAITLSTSAATSSFTFSAQTTLVRLCCVDAAFAFAFGAAPLATTTSEPLPSGVYEVRGVNPGDKINVIAI